MKKFAALVLGLCSFAFSVNGQTQEEQIKSVIKSFFEGMKKGDTASVIKCFIKEPYLYTTFERKGKQIFEKEDFLEFLKQIATPLKPGESYDERLTSWSIKIDAQMASVWTPYEFYFGDKFSHCGVNCFQLYKDETGWKIVGIMDTRRREGCVK
jgi:hypothetical protein